MSRPVIASPSRLDGHDRQRECQGVARAAFGELAIGVENAGWDRLMVAEALLRLALEHVLALEQSKAPTLT